ncbi:amphi-Trp domain-containing protein [Halorussus ruber]|uniref:amphi-Trp domain-containing protein n=1 Tax=Halorussus ruber TaxID=1126238 RepID=UPI001B300126|nr:amphi-Trp domain-containing protein [Halorussus ruber]
MFIGSVSVPYATGGLETESEKTRTEIATYLREFAEQLDSDGDVTLELADQQVQPNPTAPVTLKLEGESDWTEADTAAKQSIEFELVWWRDAETPEAGVR